MFPIPETILPAIQKARDSNQRVVLMTCGVSGSGKSTLARNLEAQFGYVRLSIDKYILERHGVWNNGVDENQYKQQQYGAREWIKEELAKLLKEGEKDVVLDMSLWESAERDIWREMVKTHGTGRYEALLVVFNNSEAYFDERVSKRNELWESVDGKDIENVEGRPVTFEMFESYCKDFEWPRGDIEVIGATVSHY